MSIPIDKKVGDNDIEASKTGNFCARLFDSFQFFGNTWRMKMATKVCEMMRVIVYREGDVWIAQCIEHDISAQGRDCQSVMRRLVATVNAECRYTLEKHGKELANIDPAPEFFKTMFEQTDRPLMSDNLEYRIAA